MITKLTSFWRDEDGATLVEYGIALFIAILVGGTLITGLADNVRENVNQADSKIAAGQENDNF